MRIDQAREHRAALEVDDPRGAAGKRIGLGGGAGGENPAVSDRSASSDARPAAIVRIVPPWRMTSAVTDAAWPRRATPLPTATASAALANNSRRPGTAEGRPEVSRSSISERSQQKHIVVEPKSVGW
jgi:hypothetical protein